MGTPTAIGIIVDRFTRKLSALAHVAATASPPIPEPSLGPRVVSYLLLKPGTGASELAHALRLDRASLRAAIVALIDQGMVRGRGNTRARVYFATPAATSRSAPPGRRRASRRRRSGSN